MAYLISFVTLGGRQREIYSSSLPVVTEVQKAESMQRNSGRRAYNWGKKGIATSLDIGQSVTVDYIDYTDFRNWQSFLCRLNSDYGCCLHAVLVTEEDTIKIKITRTA